MSRTILIGIIITVGIFVVVSIRQYTYHAELSQEQIDSLLTKHQTNFLYDKEEAKQGHRTQEPLDAGIEEPQYELFVFDPNTADTTSLLRLGFPRWMIRTMLKYRAAGGRYGDVEDIKRIPGMRPEIYDRIKDYVQIDPKFRPYDRKQLDAERKAKWEEEKSTDIPYKLAAGAKLDLNTADSAQLCQVPGISSGRAKQILIRREELGGFISVTQLRELNNFPDSCADWFEINPTDIKKLDINHAPLSALRRHPYIGTYRATAIDRYRRTNGKITSLDQLRLHPDFTDEDITRIQPYVTF